MSPHSCDRSGEWSLTLPTPDPAGKRCEMPSLVPSSPLPPLMAGIGVSPCHPNLVTGLRDPCFPSLLLVTGLGVSYLILTTGARLGVSILWGQAGSAPSPSKYLETPAMSQQRQEAFMGWW